MTKRVQEPILNSEEPKKLDTGFVKSKRRMSLDEFAVVTNLRPETKAGFKVWLKGQLYHFEPEWCELYEKFKNR